MLSVLFVLIVIVSVILLWCRDEIIWLCHVFDNWNVVDGESHEVITYDEMGKPEETTITQTPLVSLKEQKQQLAHQKTEIVQKRLKKLETLLKDSLVINNIPDWDSLYSKKQPIKPAPLAIPREPKEGDLIYRKAMDPITAFSEAHSKWRKERENIVEANKALIGKYGEDLNAWERGKKAGKEKYFQKDPEAVVVYCRLVLANSKYPENFPKQYDINYNQETQVLLVDSFFPTKENIPTLKEVKYNISQDKFKEIHISEDVSNKLYDDVLYQITLRTIHELYEADKSGAIASVVFNGFVRFVDKGTGKKVSSCILSIQAQREEFLGINLKEVDPRECFKKLKGIGSSKLHGLASIAPIMKIDRNDKRFVIGYDVINSVDDKTNIAAMYWKDFENLIRELFEKEYKAIGGEVKITRASRDEGVDAVAFDPDPIRGGKIVIQAKRYTNTVGVSAVRDLYGTVINEGAIKGILVTTTDYGPDAYKFAQDKPITLLNGSNLLHLLEKYGHKAKIDIKEAKKILTEEEDKGK